MKKCYIIMAVLAVISINYYTNHSSKPNIEALRSSHSYFLENSPFATSKHLSKKERKQLEIPPNAYNEMLWDLTMDPSIGRPAPERILKAQIQINRRREQTLSGDQPTVMQWQERGPADLGGRTRAIFFDPSDVGNANASDNYTRVFAGAVSGGLWVNQDITNPNSKWNLVPGLVSNISITKIIADPNNLNVLYIATGESYSTGQAIGNGIWKSTDSGETWEHIFGSFQGVDEHKIINGIFYVNDIVARDVGETTELYIAVAGAYFHSSGELPQFHSVNQQGLYKSDDNGLNWNKITINESNGKPINPNDIEIDIDNNIWLTTTQNNWGHYGGKIFKSLDGIDFNLVHDFQAGAGRTELEPSQSDSNKFWVLINQWNQANLYVTEDGFNTVTQITSEPNDVDVGIPADDFCRQQAFYNLVIEANENDHLFVGGINLFKSSTQGVSWEQISHWYGGYERQNVHPDQHTIVFRPGEGNENQVVFGNDGGIYYCDNIQNPYTSIQISERNKGYNTAQFYCGSIDINHSTQQDVIAGGTQDNGTWTKTNANDGINTFLYTLGGDGAYTELDTQDHYMIASYVFDEHYYISYPELNSGYKISEGNQKGDFINNAILDKNLDIFYYDQSDSNIFKITAAHNIKNGEENVSQFELTHPQFNKAPSALNISPFFKTASQLYLGLTNGKLFRIDNASSTLPEWTEITGENFLGSISDIEFGISQNELFVTMHNYGVDNIWYSNDAGQSWRSIEGDLPDIPVRCILQNPLNPKDLIIGTAIGLWQTLDFTNSSPQWKQLDQGINTVSVVDLDLRKSDNIVLATTHGRGFFTAQFLNSDERTLDYGQPNDIINVFPTASNGEINFVSNKDFGQTKVTVYNLTGQKVLENDIELQRNLKTSINLQLSLGIYLIKINTKHKQFIKRIIIK